MKIKDESNERIEQFIHNEILPFMNKEDRGFIFAPSVSKNPKKNHYTFTAVAVHSNIEFWATMLSIIDNVNKNISEDDRAKFKEGYKMFIRASAKMCFPTIQIEIENNPNHNKERK